MLLLLKKHGDWVRKPVSPAVSCLEKRKCHQFLIVTKTFHILEEKLGWRIGISTFQSIN